MEEKLLLDAKEVAKSLGISLRKLDEMVANDEAPVHMRIGRVRKWRPHDINQWIEASLEAKSMERKKERK